jgi:predicted alpha/beta-hydrolase family hydrolase
MKECLKIKVDGKTLEGDLSIPDKAKGFIVFSHGSGSSRFSPRNSFVAQHLNKRGFATFLFDLLTKEEDMENEFRFDISLLSERLREVTDILMRQPMLDNLPFAYFGASTGAASALIAASYFQSKIKAVVSRGGRPDLALQHLQNVNSPTLLLVGEYDFEVLELNEKALKEIKAPKKLQIVEGATHLFEEPGALEVVAALSGDWFEQYLTEKINL